MSTRSHLKPLLFRFNLDETLHLGVNLPKLSGETIQAHGQKKKLPKITRLKNILIIN